MVADAVLPRRGHQGCQATNEVQRVESHAGGAVSSGTAQLDGDAAAIEQAQSLGGDRRTHDVARQPLQTRRVGGANEGDGVEVEAVDLVSPRSGLPLTRPSTARCCGSGEGLSRREQGELGRTRAVKIGGIRQPGNERRQPGLGWV